MPKIALSIVVFLLCCCTAVADKSRSVSPPAPRPAPKYGGNNNSPKAKYGGNKHESGPKYGNKTGNNVSDKKPEPHHNPKAQANKEQASKNKYAEQQKATAPPKTQYQTSDGKTVNIDPKSKAVENIRNKPSSYYQPEVRQQSRIEHINVYHYHHDYNWYRSQPVVYVGGGYSSMFFYMTMEWEAERRARWFYNNRYNIESDAYNRGIRDAQVAQYVQKMEAEKRARDNNYIDPEFAKDPSLMYTQGHIEAIYQPSHVQPTKGSAAWVVLLWVFVVFVGIVALVSVLYILTQVKFRN